MLFLLFGINGITAHAWFTQHGKMPTGYVPMGFEK
jgi:hypothetical protein